MAGSTDGLLFPAVAGWKVVAQFSGGDVTSDAGLLLVREAARQVGTTEAVAEAIHDRRQQSRVRHGMREMVQERVYAIACGYEDGNDLNRLRDDAALKTVCGRRPTAVDVLAAQPTISRMENSVSRTDLLRAAIALAAAYVLMQTLETAAAGTEWANARAGTLRTRLLKGGGRVVETCRRTCFQLPSNFPYREAWHTIHGRLARQA